MSAKKPADPLAQGAFSVIRRSKWHYGWNNVTKTVSSHWIIPHKLETATSTTAKKIQKVKNYRPLVIIYFSFNLSSFSNLCLKYHRNMFLALSLIFPTNVISTCLRRSLLYSKQDLVISKERPPPVNQILYFPWMSNMSQR